MDLSLYVSTAIVKITPIITRIDDAYKSIYPESRGISTTSVKVDGTPIFVEAL